MHSEHEMAGQNHPLWVTVLVSLENFCPEPCSWLTASDHLLFSWASYVDSVILGFIQDTWPTAMGSKASRDSQWI